VFGPRQSSLVGYLHSTDRGLSFKYCGPALPCGWCHGFSNPTLAVSPQGVFYLCTLQEAQGLRIGVTRSEDGGLSFQRPVLVPKVGILPDLPHMAVDPITGRIYVVWPNLVQWQVFVAVSDDEGLTFSSPVPIGTPGKSPKHCARVTVGKDSRVYCFWVQGNALWGSSRVAGLPAHCVVA